jgi:hypothetical protein
VRKAVLAGVVAAAALVGVIVAIVVSSGDGGPSTTRAGSGGSTSPVTTPRRTTRTTRSASTSTSTATRTTPARRGPTDPVDTTSVHIPPPPGRKSARTRTLIIGTVDDAIAQKDPRFRQGQVDISRDAGFDAAVLSSMWQRGQRRPLRVSVNVMRGVARAARRARMKLFVVVWHGFARNTPRTPAERADFAAYAAALVKAVPGVRHVIVGNEPNLNTFWEPQFGSGGRDVAAFAYADLLARSYDAIKQADPGVRVLGGAVSPRGADRPQGARPTHSPTAFIRDLGTAYRRSGRKRPLMDGFAFHPYMQASRVSPTQAHPQNRSITIADYPKLVALLNEAFGGTAQPGARLPIYYTEFGVQTNVPPSKRALYSDFESPERSDSVGFATQAAYYRTAIQLAYCQPTVRGLFLFHTFDEADLGGWQSGLYFPDRTPKPSLPAFKKAVADLRNGRLPRCPR